MPWKVKIGAPGGRPVSDDMLERVSRAEESVLSLEGALNNLGERCNELKSGLGSVSEQLKSTSKNTADRTDEMEKTLSGLGKWLAALERDMEAMKMRMTSMAGKEDTAELRSYINVMMGEKLAR